MLNLTISDWGFVSKMLPLSSHNELDRAFPEKWFWRGAGRRTGLETGHAELRDRWLMLPGCLPGCCAQPLQRDPQPTRLSAAAAGLAVAGVLQQPPRLVSNRPEFSDVVWEFKRITGQRITIRFWNKKVDVPDQTCFYWWHLGKSHIKALIKKFS